MFKRKCKITFIANGSTIFNEESRFSDKDNHPPLNDKGFQEIENICEWLKRRGLKTDVIYSSPALRTVQSANLISKVFKTDFEVLDDLRARKRGVWSGLTLEQVDEKYPDLWEEIHKNPCTYCPEGGETVIQFNERNNKIISDIVNKNQGSRIIIVTHHDVIQSAICTALNINPESQARILIKPGSATQISYFDTWASLIYSDFIPDYILD